jgi:hypothetical protein
MLLLWSLNRAQISSRHNLHFLSDRNRTEGRFCARTAGPAWVHATHEDDSRDDGMLNYKGRGDNVCISRGFKDITERLFVWDRSNPWWSAMNFLVLLRHDDSLVADLGLGGSA